MANVVKYTSPMDPMGYIFGGLTRLPKPSIFLSVYHLELAGYPEKRAKKPKAS